MIKNNVIYFAHGMESGPWGTKIKALAKVAERLGFDVESPDYTSTMDADERVDMLLNLNPKANENLVLVGSSMGGYVSTVASEKIKPQGLFLLAPAFYIPIFKHQDPKPYALESLIIHGWNDEIIPAENIIRFSQTYKTALYLVDSNHVLTDQIPLIESLFALFLAKILETSKATI